MYTKYKYMYMSTIFIYKMNIKTNLLEEYVNFCGLYEKTK